MGQVASTLNGATSFPTDAIPAPAGLETKTALVFFIDRTGSMAQWIQAVVATLPSLCHSVAATDVFDTIGIMTYSDYDLAAARVVTFSGWKSSGDPKQVADLESFAKKIACEGGGGAPEAVRTGLLELARQALPPGVSRVHLLHLADAPPHVKASLDAEGKKEFERLGEHLFHFETIQQLLTTAHPTLRYTALTSCAHGTYCYLARCTGGTVVVHRGPATATAIRDGIAAVLNSWLGLPLRTAMNVQPFGTESLEELEVRTTLPQTVLNANMVAAQLKCPVIAPKLAAALKRMRVDGAFREHLISEVNVIINMDPMALTVSPILGKVWRELCKARSDPRRDEMIEAFNKAKSKVTGADRTTLDEWLKESYNAATEITEQLLAFHTANATRGLVRFDNDDASLCAQQVVQLLARGDKEATKIIRAILSRFTVDLSFEQGVFDPNAAAAASKKAATKNGGLEEACGFDVETETTLQRLRELRPKSFRTALVLLPPADIAASADAIRKEHDQAYGRWMPHITITFPCVPPEHFDAIIQVLGAALRQPADHGIPNAFEVELKRVSWFGSPKKAVVYAEPKEQEQIKMLYEAIVKLLPFLRREDRDAADGSGFHAHLTLGQCAGGTAAATASKFGEAWPAAARRPFVCGSFALIHHADVEDGAEDPGYRVVHTFDLPSTGGARVDVKSDSAAAMIDDADDEVVLPIPPRSLALNLPAHMRFELLMHCVAPGTRLTRRYAATLAMHAIQCGSVLIPLALDYLNDVRGRWINWKRRDAAVKGAGEIPEAEVPENWSRTFLRLLVSTDALVKEAGHGEVVATAAEIEKAKAMLKVADALAFFHSLELDVEVLDDTSSDAVLPCHAMLCSKCEKLRPLSLIAEDGECGYCKRGRQDQVEGMDEDGAAYMQVRCFTCGAYYPRDRACRMQGHSKCHGCQRLEEPSPSVACRECGLKQVMFYGTTLPKHGRCGPCAANVAPRRLANKSFIALAHAVFAGQFELLCAAVGLRRVATTDENQGWVRRVINNGVGLVDAAMLFEPCDAIDVAVPEVGVLFRERRPENADALWQKVINIMKGAEQIIRPECAVCLSDEQALNPACGRRDCTQRVCRGCAEEWYGKNKPGARIYDRALHCQFCARLPAPHIMRRVEARLLMLRAAVRRQPLDHANVYAWCRRCLLPHVVAERACVARGLDEDDDVEAAMPFGAGAFECRDCIARANPAAVLVPTGGAEALGVCRECPGCTVMTSKIDGCNHITCGNCFADWCWTCGEKFDDADACYAHLDSAHGGIFEGDVYAAEDDADE